MQLYAFTVLLSLPIMGQTPQWQVQDVSALANGPPAELLAPFAGQDRLDTGSPTRTRPRDQRRRRREKRRQALTLGLTTAALILTDEDSHGLLGAERGRADTELSKWTKAFGAEAGLASTLCVYALGNDYAEETAQMAGTAALSSLITAEALKRGTGRERPGRGSGHGHFGGPSSPHRSFPSAHTAVAFSLATVYGRRYPKYEWAFDALAVGVAANRLRYDFHYVSDVFVGAVVGTHFGHRALKGKGGLFGFRF